MLRHLPLLTTLATLALAPAAGAAVTIEQPSHPYDVLEVRGSAGADDVRLALADDQWRVRVTSPAGVTLTGTSDDPACVPATGGADCRIWGGVDLDLRDGDDKFALLPGYSGSMPEIHGGKGDDHFEIGAFPSAFVFGDEGSDTVAFAHFAPTDSANGISVDLSEQRGGWSAYLENLENVVGTPLPDWITGDVSDNHLSGGGGADTLDGRGGEDRVEAGAGNDTIYAQDQTADRITCGDGVDQAYADGVDTDPAGCERWTTPYVPSPVPPPTPMPPYGLTSPTYPRVLPGSTRVPTTLIRPTSGRKGRISIASRPAADGARTRVGARIRVPGAGRVRMVVKHGAREIGAAEQVTDSYAEVVVNVPLDAQLRAAVAQTRHVELDAIIELETNGITISEQYQATIAEPPAYVQGPRGVTRRGGFGPQRLFGTGRGDRLIGDSGDDHLGGRGGNDRLEGGTGNDQLAGGAGNDHLDGYDGDDHLSGGAGDDLLIESRFGDDTLSGGAGDDWIVGARGTDEISGGAGDDVIFGGSGSDVIDCGPGQDTVFVNLEIERESAKGCERILDEDDIASISCPEEGTANAETMLGSEGADLCKGHGGDDDVEGAGGSDKLFGGDGADRMFGRFGNDLMFGEGGDDELEGGRGNDRLSGGTGDDQLNGGYDSDRLDGGPGNDTLIARGGGADVLSCGPGKDVAIADRTDKLSGCETIRRG